MVNRPVDDHQVPPTDVWQPLPGPFARWPRVTDIILAVAAFTMSLSMWFDLRALHATPIGAYILFAVGSGALLWRRTEPVVAHGVILATSVVSMALAYSGPLFAIVFSLYSLGRYAGNDRWGYLGLAATVSLVGVRAFIITEPAAEGFLALLMAFLIWYFGRRIRTRGEYLRLLQERAAHLEREQAAEADKAVAEERTRIARELHDIVAHQVSLMTVQAGAAKTVVAEDPLAATQAMASVEKAGRQALNELRHLLSVLRPESDVGGLGPQPGLADIPRLVEELKKTGLEVSLTMDTLETELPARVDLSIYRIVQEALTNVLKHAGPEARAEVSVRSDGHGIAIEVLDDGHGSTHLPGSGHGIAGMRERVQLLGGSFKATPLPGGGFQIIAHLPMSEESL